MKTKSNIKLSLALLCAALGSGAAQAATWTYSSTSPTSSSGLTATASGFSATNNTTATIGATTAHYSGGLGVLSGSETTISNPDHAMDNNGRIETIMLSFSDGAAGITNADKVNLTSANFGWTNGDADFSVYAYIGTGASPTPSGLTYTSLTSNSWQLIGHYNAGSGVAGSTSTDPMNANYGTYGFANSVYSSHWLIGAYNGVNAASGVDANDDYFKMASVSGNKCPTTGTIPAGCGGGGGPSGNAPEPGTLLLLGAGFLGLTRMSRRRSV